MALRPKITPTAIMAITTNITPNVTKNVMPFFSLKLKSNKQTAILSQAEISLVHQTENKRD
jgi:hypothetical protein